MNSLCSCPSLIVTNLKLFKLFEALRRHNKKDEKELSKRVSVSIQSECNAYHQAWMDRGFQPKH